MVTLSGRSFRNWPNYVDKSVYLRTAEKVIESLGSSCLAAYRFGSHISHPGISDVDIQTVFRDEDHDVAIPSLNSFSDQERYVLKHEIPHPMPVSVFRSAQYILVPHTLQTMELIHGADVRSDFRFLSETEERYVRLVMFARVLLFGLLRSSRVLLDDTLDVRRVLTILNATARAADLAPPVGLDEAGIGLLRSYANHVEDIRDNWFQRSEGHNIEAIDHAVPLYLSVMRVLAQALVHEAFDVVGDRLSRCVGRFHKLGDVDIHFLRTDRIRYIDAHAHRIPGRGKLGECTALSVPSALLATLAPFLVDNGPLSKRVRRVLKVQGDCSSLSELPGGQMAKVLNEYYIWLLDRRVEYRLWGFFPHRTAHLRDRIKHLLSFHLEVPGSGARANQLIGQH